MRKNIIFMLLTAAILMTLAGATALAAESQATISVDEVKADNDQYRNDFLFSAKISGLTGNDDRYQVLLMLANSNGEFSDSNATLLTPMVWDNDTASWAVTKKVEKFGCDKTRRYRVVVREAVSGVAVAASQDEMVREPGKEPPINRQEALDFLGLLSKEYAAKNYRGFMNLVSPDFAGDDFVLSNAVRKDFLLLSDINIKFTVTGVSANAEFATVRANYRRSVTSIRSGERLNDSGLTELSLYKEKGQLKLYSMKKPLPFGLANNGAAATGIVNSGQNQNVLQIQKDGTVWVGPITSSSLRARTVVLRGSRTDLSYAETLVLKDGTKTAKVSRYEMERGTAEGDIAAFIVPNYSSADFLTSYNLYFKGSYQQLYGVTSIYSVTSVPASGYGNTTLSFNSLPGAVFYAVHLPNGKYAVVGITNWSGNSDSWSTTVVYKYQPDGTRNF